MNRFINGFYADAIFSLNSGKFFHFNNAVITDDDDHYTIYECNPSDDRTMIFKCSIVYMLLHPEDKKKKKAGATDGQA